MKTNDFIKFLTQQFIRFFDEPKDQRKTRKMENKQARTPLSYSLFGVIPFSISMLIKKRRL
ncbi:YqzE family protein [Peribacillus kribbensis]|uniref:YqzE family protein n=1 Tax=Peribacillus kribbensis TaxID=356658 RepID=UPI00042289F1|nr:YqzE family protein [Peribacillus kribbensis]